MIITQVNQFDSQKILDQGELVPITDEGFGYIWAIIERYFQVHELLLRKCGHAYHIEVNGVYLPCDVTNAIEFQEWYENEKQEP